MPTNVQQYRLQFIKFSQLSFVHILIIEKFTRALTKFESRSNTRLFKLYSHLRVEHRALINYRKNWPIGAT